MENTATKIQMRRDNYQNWIDNNPILDAGEIGFEIDTYKVKIGDGYSAYDKLPYVTDIIDYNELDNQPLINGVKLSGEKSLEELSIQPSGNYSIDTNVVHLYNDEVINGIKTFNESPIVPTLDTTDSSQKVANAEFVNNVANELNKEIKLKANDVNVVHIYNDEVINGIKTFNESPIVPTLDTTDSSQKVANTEFVNNVANELNNTLTESINLMYKLLPAGVVLPFAGSKVPDGYLICQGQTISRTKYSALFKAIGTLYGAGDGSTTFKIPDYRNRVLQGSSDYKPHILSAGLPNITGTFGARDGYIAQDGRTVNFNVASGAFSLNSSNQSYGTWDSTRTVTGGKSVSFNASKSNSIYGKSSTVQPPAIATMMIIKY